MVSPPIPLITFIGRSGSGKTTLVEKLIRELGARGYRLAAIKHHTKNGFDIDVPGKDSWRFGQAGARQVVIAAPDKFATYRKLEHELSLDEVAAEIRDVDLILVEGYKKSNQPSIEVMRLARNAELVGTPEQRIAMVSDQPLELGVPWFHLDDIQAIANFIEAGFLGAG